MNIYEPGAVGEFVYDAGETGLAGGMRTAKLQSEDGGTGLDRIVLGTKPFC